MTKIIMMMMMMMMKVMKMMMMMVMMVKIVTCRPAALPPVKTLTKVATRIALKSVYVVA